MNIDFYAIEMIKQEQERFRMTAEREARIHEAYLARQEIPGLRARLVARLRGSRRSGTVEAKPVSITTVSTTAMNGN